MLFAIVTVEKGPTGKVGIAFALRSDGTVVIKEVADDSPFASSVIRPGMAILNINDIPCDGLDAAQIGALFKTQPAKVRIVAALLEDGVKASNIQVATADELATGKIGLEFEDGADGNVVISKVAEDGAFAATAIKKGMRILSINKVSCNALEAKQVSAIYRSLPDLVTVFAGNLGRSAGDKLTFPKAAMSFFEATAMKNESGKVGLYFKEESDGTVTITKISDTSPFASTNIKDANLTILTINGVSCHGLRANQIKAIIGAIPDSVSVIGVKRGSLPPAVEARNMQVATAEKNANGKIGLKFRRESGSNVVITDIADDSPFASTGIATGMSILSVNNMACTDMTAGQVRSFMSSLEGPITLVCGKLYPQRKKAQGPAMKMGRPIAVSEDKNPNGKVGLSFADRTDGSVVITKIAEDSPFAGTDLKPGMTILTINTISCHGKDASKIRSFFQSLPDTITLIAAERSDDDGDIEAKDLQVVTANKDSSGKVGLAFVKTSEGLVVITNIADSSPFANSTIRKGMTILTINNVYCHGMDAEQIRSLFKAVPDPITLVAAKLSGAKTPRASISAIQPVAVMANKNASGKVELSFADNYADGTVVITKIPDSSPFADTALTKDMTILTINGVPCHGFEANQIKAMLGTLESPITLVAANMTAESAGMRAKEVQYASANRNEAGKVGLSLIDKDDGSVVIKSISDSSPFAGSNIREGMAILSVNEVSSEGMDAEGIRSLLLSLPEPITIFAGSLTTIQGLTARRASSKSIETAEFTKQIVSVTAQKNAKGKIGLSFADRDGSVVVARISKESPFAETEITKNMSLLTINTISCADLSASQVASIVSTLPDTVTIVGATLDGMRAKDIQVITADKNTENRVGLSFVDKRDGSVVISSISESSPFAPTMLSKGMCILTINGISCHGMDANQIKALFRAVPNPITLCAGLLNETTEASVKSGNFEVQSL